MMTGLLFVFFLLFAQLRLAPPALIVVAMSLGSVGNPLGFLALVIRPGLPWIVVVALAGHGVFDAVHGRIIENAGVPAWWPAWCLAYDVGAAGCLAWLLRRGLTAHDTSRE